MNVRFSTANSSFEKYKYSKMAHTNGSYDAADSGAPIRPHILEINKSEVDFTSVRRGPSTQNQSSISPQSSTFTVASRGAGSQVNLTSTPSSKSEYSISSKPEKPRSGPSSRRTVLIIASFFVVGTIFLLSGVIILSKEDNPAFVTTGAVFIGIGISSFVLCLFLQQKNLKKLMRDLEQDLYFLNMADNPLLRSFFSFETTSYPPNHPRASREDSRFNE